MNPLVESWDIHNRITLYLLDAIPEEALVSRLASGGRNVAEQFGHIHNVRLMWLKSADGGLSTDLSKIEKSGITKSDLRAALSSSAPAIAKLLGNSLTGDGKVKGFKPHATAFAAYLISHESHHRGQIALALKQAGHPLDKKVSFGLWEWGTR